MKTLRGNNREALPKVIVDLKNRLEFGSNYDIDNHILYSKQDLYHYIMDAKWPKYFELYCQHPKRWGYHQSNWEPIMYWLKSHGYIDIVKANGKQTYTITLNRDKIEQFDSSAPIDYTYGNVEAAKDIVENKEIEIKEIEIKEIEIKQEDMVFECKVGDVVYDAVFAKGLTGKVINTAVDSYTNILVQFGANCFRHYTADGRAFESVIPTLSHEPYSADLKLSLIHI
jgi:hypothetical protein